MLDPETYLIKERMLYISDAKEASGAVLSCHLTGLTIEGLTVLASVTGNNEWNKMAINIARAAIHYEGWHNSDGILIASTDGNASEFTETKAMKGDLFSIAI
ncbi:hypothetical protein FRC02_005577 [Tulasnella sp. 418]|nr:hypothetical protein FRC02_005577 [Tulasnella sp. 418]